MVVDATVLDEGEDELSLLELSTDCDTDVDDSGIEDGYRGVESVIEVEDADCAVPEGVWRRSLR